MATVHHRVSIDSPVRQVYEAISVPEKIGTWWDEQTAVQTERGLVLEHNPGPEHGVVRLRVVEQVPNQRVEWECVSTHPTSSPAAAWTGTHFIFNLTEQNGHGRTTTLDFRQVGYDEHGRFFESNQAAWAEVIENLKHVVEARSS